ncbi:hypothetical protein D9615_002827 [Tricholomella constricta]|uniref:DUF6534 domain-containing protein n=1 Tax=Tricholomella constricta TaxID=117010 RepID=A0A8H5HFQ1_9AGAR|nr:hypothetical protein D9615_002827 [Tricholomella constricta]
MGSLDASLGALLLGVFLNTYFYGIVSFQYIAYHYTKFNDPLWIRALVFSFFCLDTFHSTSIVYMIWVYAAQKFNDPMALHAHTWPYRTVALTTAIAAFLAQMFLGYRIFRLTRNKIGYCIIIFLSLTCLVLGILSGSAFNLKIITHAADLKFVLTAWLCLEVCVDSLITGVLCYILSRSRTGFHTSDTIIKRLIRASVQTGLFTGLFTMVSLVLFLKFPTSHLSTVFGFPVGRVYSNTLMDTLLVRHTLRELVNGSRTDTSGIWELENLKRFPQASTKTSVQLHIRTEVYSDAHVIDNDPPTSPFFEVAKKHLPATFDDDDDGLESRSVAEGWVPEANSKV